MENETLALLRGWSQCQTCQTHGFKSYNRYIAGRMYVMKIACVACNGRGWLDEKGKPVEI